MDAARARIGFGPPQPQEEEVNIFKDIEVNGLTIYVNSQSEMFIPTSLWKETKFNANGIFDAMPASIIASLMDKQDHFTFIMDPMDLFANFADIKGEKAFFSLLCNRLKLKFTPDSLTEINTLL